MKKKSLLLIIAVAMCIVFAACDSSDYKKAEKLFAAGDYAAALEIYTALGEYEDAKEKAAYCEKEVGMTENADYAFLADIESSVLGRMEAPDGADRKQLVNTELAYLEKYSDETFYDATLKEIADKYIEGLCVQKEALKKDAIWKYQIEWQKGLVLRYEALTDLYKKYDFLSDKPEFVGTYVATLEDQQHLLNGYNAIEADLTEQMNAEGFSWGLSKGGHNIYCTLKNNTEYTFGLFVNVFFYDVDGVLFETNTGYVEEIKPDETYVVEVYVSDASKIKNLGWITYYDYVK